MPLERRLTNNLVFYSECIVIRLWNNAIIDTCMMSLVLNGRLLDKFHFFSYYYHRIQNIKHTDDSYSNYTSSLLAYCVNIPLTMFCDFFHLSMCHCIS